MDLSIDTLVALGLMFILVIFMLYFSIWCAVDIFRMVLVDWDFYKGFRTKAIKILIFLLVFLYSAFFLYVAFDLFNYIKLQCVTT